MLEHLFAHSNRLVTLAIAYNMQSIPIAGMKLADTAEIYSKVNRPPSTRPPVNNNVRPITGKLY